MLSTLIGRKSFWVFISLTIRVATSKLTFMNNFSISSTLSFSLIPLRFWYLAIDVTTMLENKNKHFNDSIEKSVMKSNLKVATLLLARREMLLPFTTMENWRKIMATIKAIYSLHSSVHISICDIMQQQQHKIHISITTFSNLPSYFSRLHSTINIKQKLHDPYEWNCIIKRLASQTIPNEIFNADFDTVHLAKGNISRSLCKYIR